MASSATAARHVVAVPYPGSGHINPMLAVCRLLVAADGALTVTVVVTEEWHALLASAPTLPDRLRFATIPNDVIPPERSRGVDHAAFFEAVRVKMALMAEPVEQLVLELEPRPEGIVVDTYLTWGVAVGTPCRIPVCSLWTQPATFFLALYHLDLWPSGDDDHEHDEELSTKSLDQYVPCLSSVRMSDLKVFSRWKRHMKVTAEAFVNVRKAQCLLLTSFHELEPCAIDTTAELLPFPVYPIGPAHMPPDGNAGRIQDEEHPDWLDAQPEKSVMYVSFGSYASMPHSQFQEIAMGLLDAGVKFFWVARDKAPELRRMCGDKQGLAVPWCDQQKVLCHPSVGGFLSHCGWNSVLEAVCAGVPVLAFPVAWDQLVNARMIADEWKVGVDLREQRGEDGTVSRAAISGAARKLMDSDSGVGQEMRKRAAELREASRAAVLGGSSHCSLSGFLKDLAEGRLEVAESSQ